MIRLEAAGEPWLDPKSPAPPSLWALLSMMCSRHKMVVVPWHDTRRRTPSLRRGFTVYTGSVLTGGGVESRHALVTTKVLRAGNTRNQQVSSPE